MRKRSKPRNHTTTTTTERVNTTTGYRVSKTTTTKYEHSFLDALIDLFS